MELKESVKRQQESHEKSEFLRVGKGQDYAHPESDCLSNFKVMADIQKVLIKHGYAIPVDKPHGVAMWHLLHKVVRILKLWKDEVVPINESLGDSHVDIDNYNYLGEHCYIDYKNEHSFMCLNQHLFNWGSKTPPKKCPICDGKVPFSGERE